MTVRPAQPEDIDFIMDSWKRSWRVSPWAGVVRNDEYFRHIESTIEGIIGRGSALTVAVHETGRIMGWMCSEVMRDGTCCIHYLYVKDPYIPLGIGRQLVESAAGTKPGLYSFRYRQVAEACTGWRHAPEVARRK